MFAISDLPANIWPVWNVFLTMPIWNDFSGILELLLCEIFVKWSIIMEVTAILVKIMKTVHFHMKIHDFFASSTIFYLYMSLC